MAKLTDEEIRILQRARIIQDRLEAERLEAGEELPAKKAQPKIQKQKLGKTKNSPAQQREAVNTKLDSMNHRVPTAPRTRRNEAISEGDERQSINSTRDPQMGRDGVGIARSELTEKSLRRAAVVAEESAKKKAEAASTANIAETEIKKRAAGTGAVSPKTGERKAIRHPVATVEEKRNRSLAAGTVRHPVGTIETAGKRMESQMEHSAEKTESQRKSSAQQRNVHIENGKDPKQVTRAEAVKNPSRQMKSSDKRAVQKTTEKKNPSNQTKRSGKSATKTSVKKTAGSSSAAARRQRIAKKKKAAKWKIVLIAVLITLLIAAIAAVGAFIFIYSNISRTNYEPISRSERSADVMPQQKGVKNILLLGTDERDIGEASRSDAIIVLSINENKKKIVMTSILRDSYVTIPGYEQNRINHAYQMGGAALMIETIEENFKIPIDSYAKVDFFSFMGIIDKLGGVPITVTQEELGYLNGYISEINALQGIDNNDGQLAQAGTYQLNGKQALAYSRIRYVGTDFARTERQRTVLDGIFQQMKTASPKELYEVFTTILPDVTTNIGDMELTKLLVKSVFYMKYDIVQNRIPMDGTWSNLVVGGQEVLGIDFEANQAGLKSIVYEE